VISRFWEATTAKRIKTDPYQRRNCSPLNALFSALSHGVPPLGASNKGGVGKISSFLSFSVNISKTVADTAKVTINN